MTATGPESEQTEYSSTDTSPQEFEDTSVEILERFLGKDAAKDSVAFIREAHGNVEAIASSMMGIVLGLSEENRVKFVVAETYVLSQKHKGRRI